MTLADYTVQADVQLPGLRDMIEGRAFRYDVHPIGVATTTDEAIGHLCSLLAHKTAHRQRARPCAAASSNLGCWRCCEPPICQSSSTTSPCRSIPTHSSRPSRGRLIRDGQLRFVLAIEPEKTRVIVDVAATEGRVAMGSRRVD